MLVAATLVFGVPSVAAEDCPPDDGQVYVGSCADPCYEWPCDSYYGAYVAGVWVPIYQATTSGEPGNQYQYFCILGTVYLNYNDGSLENLHTGTC